MVTIRRDKHYNIVNNISEVALSIILILIISALVYVFGSSIEINTNEPINIIELKAKYKNYIIVNKYQEKDICILDIKNPINNKVNKQQVKDYIYYNIYYVGDTIK